MSLAENQHRAHIERQRRLGNSAPRLAGARQVPTVSSAQARTVEALQQEISQLTARLMAMAQEDQSPMAVPSRIKPVMSAVAKYYEVSITDIVSSRRSRSLIRPRQVAMYLAKALTKHSLPAIGRVFDRDHTTILHGCRRIEQLRQQDPTLEKEIGDLTERLMPPATNGPGLPKDRWP